MPARQQILEEGADRILALPSTSVVRVGIDGVDGAGKTTFADELAPLLQAAGRPVIRASVDSFHNPRSTRYRLGKHSPQGFFLDSYNYQQLRAVLLDPLGPGGSGLYRSAIFDHRTDSPVMSPEKEAPAGSILLFDGIFLHRPELRDVWEFSIFLEVGFDISIPRGAQRGEGSPDPHAAENYRYVEGQRLYLHACSPRAYATMIINNEELAFPFIVSEGEAPGTPDNKGASDENLHPDGR